MTKVFQQNTPNAERGLLMFGDSTRQTVTTEEFSQHFQDNPWSIEVNIKIPLREEFSQREELFQGGILQALLVGGSISRSIVLQINSAGPGTNPFSKNKETLFAEISGWVGLTPVVTSSSLNIISADIPVELFNFGDWNHVVFGWNRLSANQGIALVFVNGAFSWHQTITIPEGYNWWFDARAFAQDQNRLGYQIDNYRILKSCPWPVTGFTPPVIPFDQYAGDPIYGSNTLNVRTVNEGIRVDTDFFHYNQERRAYIVLIEPVTGSFDNSDFVYVDVNNNPITTDSNQDPHVDTSGDLNFHLDWSGTELSGAKSQTVRMLIQNDLKTEGSETFKIHFVDYHLEQIVLTKTVTISDTSVPTYAISPSSTSVNEGSSVTFTVTTQGLTNGTTLYWSTASSDFSPSSGSFTINNNTGSFSITAIADVTTEGTEIYSVNVRTGSISGTIVASASVTINDTSLAPAYSAAASTTSQNEDQTITITVTTANVSNGTTLYYTVAAVSGTVNSSDFVSPTTGSFTINNNTGSFNLQARTDEITEGSETYRVSIRTGSTSGTVVANAPDITLNDTSRAISVSISASTSAVNEGSTVTFSIATTNAPNGRTFTWEMTSSQYFTADDFSDNTGSGTIVINNNAASLSRTLKNDAAWDGVESFSINIKDGSTIKATSPIVKVNDTSNPGNHPTTFIHPDYTSRSLTAGVFDAIPVSTEWNENICKIIYTRDEMQRAGWYGPRVINGLYVGVAETPPQHEFNNYKVYVGNVTASPGQDFTLNATNDIRCNAHDRYFIFGFLSSGFKFDRSFTWDGESNIGIIFTWNVRYRTIFQSYVLGKTMATDTGQYNNTARNSPSYAPTDGAGLINNYRPLILFTTSTLASHTPVPYLYSPNWVNEYASTYGYTTTTQRNNFITRGQDLGNNIFKSNAFLGNISGVDRYGLYRRPDASGLAFWTDWCLDRGLTSTSTTFLQNFFGGMTGGDDTRSRTAGKQYDAGSGIGDFYDKS